jgi:serine phosphatase RsbU (regulator of sigma subunit)
MSDQPGTGDGLPPEVARGLEHLARLALDGVAGCDGASVSVPTGGSFVTLAATGDDVRELDETQYQQDDGPCVQGIRDQQTVTVEDYRRDQRWPEVAAHALRAGIRSSHSLPLVGEDGGTVGGLNLYGRIPAAFDERSRRSADVFARHCAMMLDQLQQLHVERAARASQYDLAATLQRSLLPTLPALEGISCAARYLVSHGQAAQVGGDWYDLFALPDGAIGVAIGDVMGHDVAAAAAMGQLRSVLRSYAYEGTTPAVVLDRLDRLVQGFEMAQVATAIYGRLTFREGGGTLLFANAGHLPPLVRRPDGRVERIEAGTSPLIGVVEDGSPRSEAVVALPPGSLLLLYTDGLVETRNRDFDTGIDLLCAALEAIDPQVGPEQLCDEIVATMDEPAEDDVAVLVIEIDPLPS